MKNKIIKYSVIALIVIVLLTSVLLLSICNKGGNNGDSSSSNGINESAVGTVTPSTSLWDTELDAIHEINVKKGDKDLVANSQTEYKIVVPASASETVAFAASELKYFIDEATGSNMEIISDSSLTYNDSVKYISIGETSLLSAASISINKTELGSAGYRIISKGNTVFLVGGGEKGTLYSVYGFLDQEIDLEVYGEGEIYFTKNTSLKLHEFDVTDVPDFEFRMSPGGPTWTNNNLRYRMRFEHENRDDIWMGPENTPWHNTLEWMPKSKYQEAHPLWYMDDGKDVCFNAHGDEVEAQAFLDEFMVNFIAVIEEHPNCENVTITQEDLNTWCDCWKCTEEKEHYGTNAGTIVKFCNKVSDRLKLYFEEKGINRKINICFFAYQKTTAAPVIKNEKGEYVPIDQDVICRDNVYCYYAPITAAFLYGFDDPKNAYYLETMEKWYALTDHMYLWIYHVNFYDLFEPYNCISSMQSTYIVLKAHGGKYLYDQGWCTQQNTSGWERLRAYLTSKLSWNVKENYNQLVSDFMDNYYKDAAEPMKKAFALYETWFAHLKNDLSVEGSYLSSTLFTKENFPKGFCDSMLACFDEAYKAIEPLKTTNPALYETLKRRICLETFQYRYMNIEYHRNYYTEAELLELKLSFRNDTKYVGISMSTESKGIDELFKNWGIQ